MGFLATFLGAAFGVVAGALIQYLFAFLIERRKRRRLLADLQIETQYNLVVVDQMLDEVRRFRAAANPSAFEGIQKAIQFFDSTLEQNFIVGKINELKKAKDIPGSHQFANYLESEINTHKRTIERVLRKRR